MDLADLQSLSRLLELIQFPLGVEEEELAPFASGSATTSLSAPAPPLQLLQKTQASHAIDVALH